MPILSSIICTYNRAPLLRRILEAFVEDTTIDGAVEILVIDDGSADDTAQVVADIRHRLPIRYFFQRNSGLTAAKNHWLFAARGDIVLFLDDDAIPQPGLLARHLHTHAIFPDDDVAVLHRTVLDNRLRADPLMNYVTEVGCHLFSYPHLCHGDELGFQHFWGGRTSCKRRFLIDHGVFNQVFRYGCEDIELGFGLSRHRLRVIYNALALAVFARSISFDDFCHRSLRQGRSQFLFAQIHEASEVQELTRVRGAVERWQKLEPDFDKRIRIARELDRYARLRSDHGFTLDDKAVQLLHDGYAFAFRACITRGIFEAATGLFDDTSAEPDLMLTDLEPRAGRSYVQPHLSAGPDKRSPG